MANTVLDIFLCLGWRMVFNAMVGPVCCGKWYLARLKWQSNPSMSEYYLSLKQKQKRRHLHTHRHRYTGKLKICLLTNTRTQFTHTHTHTFGDEYVKYKQLFMNNTSAIWETHLSLQWTVLCLCMCACMHVCMYVLVWKSYSLYL